jgi:hypothetical protein
LGCGPGSSGTSSSQRSSSSSGKPTVVAFVRRSFHYFHYFSSCFATATHSERCFDNSDSNFPSSARSGSYSDHFSCYYFILRPLAETCSC